MDKTILTVVNSTPNYSEIFKDMIAKNRGTENISFKDLAFEKIKGTLDLLELQEKIFSSEKSINANRESKRLMTYTQKDILKIMKYKQKHNLSVTEVANKFKVSRSTIFNWIRKNVQSDLNNQK